MAAATLAHAEQHTPESELQAMWREATRGEAQLYLGQVEPVVLKKPLAEFPLEFQERQGRKSFMTAEIWERVGGQDYVSIDYFKKDMGPINFYVAYYEYQRKAGDFVHSPKLCLPGGGWFIEKSGVRKLKPNPHGGAGLESLVFNEMVVEKGGRKPVPVKLHVHGERGEYLPPNDRHRIPNPAWFEDYSVDFVHAGHHICSYIPGETVIK